MAAEKQTLSANGNSAARVLDGPGLVRAAGTFGGGTASLQVQLDDRSFETVESANSETTWYLDTPGRAYRINLAGATTPSLDCIFVG